MNHTYIHIRQTKFLQFVFVILLASQIPSTSTKIETYEIRSPRVNNLGNWGSWGWCPDNAVATGFRIKVARKGGDDTALNGVALKCNNSPIWGVSLGGDFGIWSKPKSCPEGAYIYGFKLRSKEPCGHWCDNTAANDIIFYCRDLKTGMEVRSVFGGGHDGGMWTEAQYCSYGYGICGIQTQVEENQGSGDDTSLNNVDFQCCWDKYTMYNSDSDSSK